MSINRLHDTWFARILQLWPQERITRLRNLAWLLVGIWASRSVHVSRVAGHIPGAATQTSLTRRLARFLDNAAVRVRVWYQPLAQSVLRAMATTVGEIRLVADASKVGFHHQLLMVALAYRRRTIPIAWGRRAGFVAAAVPLVVFVPVALAPWLAGSYGVRYGSIAVLIAIGVVAVAARLVSEQMGGARAGLKLAMALGLLALLWDRL
jgi:hypothetical protein